jgi:toxin ParE1/3/4
MRCEFHPGALQDVKEAAEYYAARVPGLDLRFIDAVEETVERILAAPARWRIVEDDIRRCLTHVFPHGVIYTIEQDFVLILAVMHCSREPGYWTDRAK